MTDGPAKKTTLSGGLQIARNETYSINSRGVHDVHGAGNVRKIDGIAAINERDFFGALTENGLKTRTQIEPRYSVLIDPETVWRKDANDN